MFQKVMNKANDLGNQAMCTVLGVERTVDENFELDRTRFDAYCDSVEGMSKELKKQAHSILALKDSFKAFVVQVEKFNAGEGVVVESGTLIFATDRFCEKCDAHIGVAQQFDARLINLYQELKLYKKEIVERDRVLVEYDKVRHDYSKEQGKKGANPATLSTLLSRLDATKQMYEKKNEETKMKISHLYRVRDIHTDYDLLIKSFGAFLSDAGQSFTDLSRRISTAPRQQAPLSQPQFPQQQQQPQQFPQQQPQQFPQQQQPSVSRQMPQQQPMMAPHVSQAPPAMPPRQSALPQARALYQFNAESATELSLRPGDIVTLTNTSHPEWWIGTCNGRSGEFPSNYVQRI